MRDATVHPQWLTHVLAQRDGAYAMDALRDIARQANSPSLAVAERELASRGDPLCDQAVAAFGRDATAVRAVYGRTQDPLVRFAVLANPYYQATGWAGSVLDLEQAATLLTVGDDNDIAVFMACPRLSPDGLLDVLLRRGPAAGLTPAHATWPSVFRGLAENPALGDLFDTGRRLPGAAARQAAHGALLACIEWLSPSEALSSELAVFLVALYDELPPGASFQPNEVADVARRWRPASGGDATGAPCFRVQMMLDILYGRGAELVPPGGYASARAAAMAKVDVGSAEDLETLHSQDEAAFFAGMPFNIAIYEDAALGAAFVGMAAGRNEGALAIYLGRRVKFDRLWRLDRPVTARDLAALRRAMRDDHQWNATKQDIAVIHRDGQTAVDEQRAWLDWTRLRVATSTLWRRAFLGGLVIIILLMLLELFEIHSLAHNP
ncbi:hypothetical protein [Rhodanobacter sp. FW106-PBR-R2A-1-13]|uniref:hypothetical protein n=1 Tax=Rhodanobacter sp. FW106-PBR-R2A-1-13 TaxID=3454845 RepID=UPI0034E4BA4A